MVMNLGSSFQEKNGYTILTLAMLKRRLLFSYSITFFIAFLFCLKSCKAQENNQCHHSSCGDIRNISYPFRLKGDPQTCGHPSFEPLSCENNHTILNFNSKRYYVKAINYDNFTIQLVDPGLNKDNCSSFPIYTLSDGDIPEVSLDAGVSNDTYYALSSLNTPVIFITCLAPANSSRYITNTAFCRERNTSKSSLSSSQHVAFWNSLKVSDIKDSCSIQAVAWFSLTHRAASADIHDRLINGFELLWFRVYCSECEARNGYCYRDNNAIRCQNYCAGRLTFRCLLDSIISYWNAIYRALILAIGMALVARFFIGIVCLFTLLVYKFRRRHLSMYDTIEDFLQSHNNLVPIKYTYSDIRKMTSNFKDKLGEGGFGIVFKGKLRSGSFSAVKMMGKSLASGQEFISEVATIGRIHHVNVVQLVGFCAEGSKRALVYDFMPNGSLDKYIFPREGNIFLSCEKLYKISLGVARGIEYLHRGCDMQILHFDIKPHNILLDKNFTPKVSDFGLAKLYSTDDSIVPLTAARGTMGYMAPELFYKNIGGVSYKADVYSFGMLLMEMAGRRKNLNAYADHSSQIYFPSWAYDQFSEGKDIEIGATTDEEKKMVKKMIIVALWCIQLKPSDRPSMNKVVEMLEGDVELLKMPPKPFISPQEIPAEDHKVDTTLSEFTGFSSDPIDSLSLDI